MKSKAVLFSIIVVVTILLINPLNALAIQKIKIISAVADQDLEMIYIIGENFGDNPGVMLNDVEINVISWSDISVEAELPVDIEPGTYRLLVAKNDQFRRYFKTARMDVTLGAVGPQGPQGIQGPPGVAPEEIQVMQDAICNLFYQLQTGLTPEFCSHVPPPIGDKFDVILESAGDKKIEVIKEVRAITGLGLKDAKALVDGAPNVVKTELSIEEAEQIQAQLEAAGAKVEVRPSL